MSHLPISERELHARLMEKVRKLASGVVRVAKHEYAADFDAFLPYFKGLAACMTDFHVELPVDLIVDFVTSATVCSSH